MKQFFQLIIILFFVCTLSGCAYDRGVVLLNSVPITENNALHGQNIFRPGSKVYFLFIAPKKMYNDFIRVQVFSLTNKADLGGEDMIRTKDFRLMRDERYYYTDYFTIWEKGRYVIQIFSHEDFTNPLAVREFFVQ